jgi:hypothetical protein
MPVLLFFFLHVGANHIVAIGQNDGFV